MAGAWFRGGRAAIPGAAGAAIGRASRSRRQRRSVAASRGQVRRGTAQPEVRARHAIVARSVNRRAARVKLLRTIRLDPSDTFVFDKAAEPGEWAVSGGFAFAGG